MKPALACLALGLLLIGGALAGAHANRPGILVVESEDAPPPPADAVGGPRLYRATLRNTGGRPVKIRAVEASCGCAKPTVSPTTVPPGDVTTVEPPGGTVVPRPRCDLPFLEIACVATSNSDPTEDGSIVRTHRYLLRAAEDPPEGTTVGEVSVEDPWNTGRVESRRPT